MQKHHIFLSQKLIAPFGPKHGGAAAKAG